MKIDKLFQHGNVEIMFLAKVVANHGFVQAFSVEQELRDVLLTAADALVVNEELDALDGQVG